MLLSVTNRSCQCQASRGLFYSSKKGISRDTVAWMHQPIDFSFTGLLRWLKERSEKALIADHRFTAHCCKNRTIVHFRCIFDLLFVACHSHSVPVT